MKTYDIVFTDGTSYTITCSKYIIESGIVRFLDSENNTLLIVNLYTNVKYIKSSN